MERVTAWQRGQVVQHTAYIYRPRHTLSDTQFLFSSLHIHSYVPKHFITYTCICYIYTYIHIHAHTICLGRSNIYRSAIHRRSSIPSSDGWIHFVIFYILSICLCFIFIWISCWLERQSPFGHHPIRCPSGLTVSSLFFVCGWQVSFLYRSTWQ